MYIEMTKAVELAERSDPNARIDGFKRIEKIAAGAPASEPDLFGFLDNSLFIARKCAADVSAEVRAAVTKALAAIGSRDALWRDAALEAADEIGMQPSSDAKTVGRDAAAMIKNSWQER